MLTKSNFIARGASVLALTFCSLATALAQTTPVVIKGTPYLNDTYVEGKILYANNTRTIPIRYNAFKDLIEFQEAGQPRVLDANKSIKKVFMGESTFVVEKYSDEGKSKIGYLEVLDSGKAVLYCKRSVKLTPALKGRALDGSDQPAEFRRSADTFYFKIGEGELTEIENIKEMIAAFPDKQDELTKFAKKERISPRKEKEVVQLVKYYNAL